MTRSNRIIAFVLVGGFVIGTVFFSGWAIWSFLQEDNEDQVAVEETAENEEELLEDFEPQDEPYTELEIIDTVVGGESAKEVKSKDDDIVINYTGALAKTGVIFDKGEEVEFELGGLIQGWKEGLIGMKVGGQRRLLIPADKAYGDLGKGSVPPNADLVFDIELIGVEN